MNSKAKLIFNVLIIFLSFLLINCNLKNYDLPPEVKIILPESGTTVTDSVIVRCLCSDDNSVEKVELWIDASHNDSLICTTEPYEFVLYAKDFERGQKIAISARVYDDEDNYSDSDPIYLTMCKIDQTPTIQIVYPSEETDVKDSITVVCSASDDSEITRVELLINGSYSNSLVCYEKPYEFTLYAEDYYNTRLQLVARAYDDSGQQSYSDAVYVNMQYTIDNGEYSDLFAGQYIYMASRESEQNIYRYNFSTSMIEQMTYSNYGRYPVYLNDIDKIAYRDYDASHIYTMNMDGSDQQLFYEIPTSCYGLDYCSQNSTFYFYIIENRRKMGMINDAGFNYLTTSDTYHDLSPDVNNTGDYLAFISDRTGINQLYLYNLENDNDEQVFTTSTKLKRPDWSKISNGIYYIEYTGEKYLLKYYDIEQNTKESIFESVYDFNFTFSPSEKYAVLAFLDSPTPDLYILNVENGNTDIITNTALDFIDVQWVNPN